MNEEQRWNFMMSLDDELLKGGATMSEWCAFIVRECDIAFAAGANLATVITATTAVETYLRAEYGAGANLRLVELINQAPISTELKNDVHKLRKYRNQWVHIAKPKDDQAILENPEAYEVELESWAMLAQRTLRRTIYENQWV